MAVLLRGNSKMALYEGKIPCSSSLVRVPGGKPCAVSEKRVLLNSDSPLVFHIAAYNGTNE
jgi:hypothetical protein